MEFQTHNLKVGDTVRLVNLQQHPFAQLFLEEDKPAKVIIEDEFMGMPYVHVAQKEDDADGVAFAREDLLCLVKIEEEL